MSIDIFMENLYDTNHDSAFIKALDTACISYVSYSRKNISDIMTMFFSCYNIDPDNSLLYTSLVYEGSNDLVISFIIFYTTFRILLKNDQLDDIKAIAETIWNVSNGGKAVNIIEILQHLE